MSGNIWARGRPSACYSNEGRGVYCFRAYHVACAPLRANQTVLPDRSGVQFCNRC